MRAFILIIVALTSVVVGRSFAGPSTQPAAETSPHVEALQLVFEKCGDRIRAVDKEEWWFDTKEREWTAMRPVEPGIIDSTHMFFVDYKIGGTVVLSWIVDTRAGTVRESGQPATRPAK